MSTVLAERKAVEALAAYLKRALPAKVTSINSGRAVIFKAPRAGPYTIPASGSLALGIVPGSEAANALTAGSRTATQVAAQLAVTGITASVDSQDRLTLTASQAPSGATQSIVSLGPDATGTNAAFGWSPGGEMVARAALVAPGNLGVSDGQPEHIDFGAGFWVVIGDRTTEPRSANIRDDTHRVKLKLELLASEPNGDVIASREYIDQVVRAVRECVLEDRTLDSEVHIAHIPSNQTSAKTFRFKSQGASPLMSSAEMTVHIQVFERS